MLGSCQVTLTSSADASVQEWVREFASQPPPRYATPPQHALPSELLQWWTLCYTLS